MSYTPPAGNAAHATWAGTSPYSPPVGDAADASWAGAHGISGALSVTLAAVACQATATLRISGTLERTLADAVLSGDGRFLLPITGTLERVLADATCQATATLRISGTLERVLADAALSGEGQFQLSITGALESMLADATCQATATLPVISTLSGHLADVTGQATATLRISGTLSGLLAHAMASGAATTGRQPDAASAAVRMALTLAADPPLIWPLPPDAVDAIRQEAASEAPSVSVRLPNAGGEALRLLTPPPLLAGATIRLGDEVLFSGRLRGIASGAQIVLSLEA